jgi:nucleoside-diphosphate-sugar epimerase
MKAIVTGASGFIGSHLVCELIKDGFKVAAIGRKNFKSLPSIRKTLLKNSVYFNFDLDKPYQIKSILKKNGFSGAQLKYFFHFAWGGYNGLSDLNIEAQNKNISRTLLTYEIANFLSADRYIFCGTMEESFAELFTNLSYKNETKYNRHVVYALAKISARQALKLRYSKNGPDLLFGTNSHTMGPGDTRDSFLQTSLEKILNKQNLKISSGEQFFDVINVKDCARAYLSISKKGKLGESYWIGSGKPKKLKEYVEIMNNLFSGPKIKYRTLSYDDVFLEKKIFNIDKIKLDTGFFPLYKFSDTVIQLADYLRSSKK